MADNLTGAGQATDSYRTDWSPAGDREPAGNHGLATVSSGGIGKAASDLTEAAHQYTDKVSDAVSQAKDFLGDKVSTITDKIKEFTTNDLGEFPEKAKNFARQNPGQAILVSAAAGLLLGLIVRGRR